MTAMRLGTRVWLVHVKSHEFDVRADLPVWVLSVVGWGNLLLGILLGVLLRSGASLW